MSSERLNGHDRPQSNLKALSAALGLPTPDEAYLTAKDGAKLRYAHWQTEAAICQGVVLYLGGRTEFIEKTIDTYALLVESGFDLWSLDWRGQGLSARALADPHKGHVTDYQTYLDDLDHFVREVTDLPARRDKRLMLAHSMGGHIGLRFLHDHPGLIDAAVLSAPMIDIFVNNSFLRWLAYLIRGLGFGERYLPGKGGYRPIYQNPADARDNGTIEDYQRLIAEYRDLSHDAKKRAEIERYVRENPKLALGAPTTTWLNATFRSIDLTWAGGFAEAIETPVLIIGGGDDTTVVNARLEQMAERLQEGEFRLIERAGHELLVECDDIYRRFFEEFRGWANVDIKTPPIDMAGCIRSE